MQFVGQSKRLPFYLVIDVSGSMSGAPIEAVNNGLREFETTLKGDPHALESAHISVITFSNDAQVMTPLVPAVAFTAPRLSTGGGTSLGAAINLLSKTIDSDVKPRSPDHPGDWKPLVFLFTDGAPTDKGQWEAAVDAFNRRQTLRPANVWAIGCGQSVDQSVLKRITENVLLSNDLTTENIRALFKWISQSAKVASRTASQNVAVTTSGAPTTAQLPPAPPGFTVAL